MNGIVVDGKVITSYPYMHYHYSQFVSDNNGWNASSAQHMFQQAFKANQSINLSKQYDNKSYNLDALSKLNDLLGELQDPQSIEDAIVKELQEQRNNNSELQRKITDITNFNQNYSRLAQQTNATSRKINNFITKLSNIFGLAEKDKEILLQVALKDEVRNGKFINLKYLAEGLANQTGVIKTGDVSKLTNFLNQFNSIMSSEDTSKNKKKQLTSAIISNINTGIGEELDMQVVQRAIGKIFNKDIKGMLTGSNTRAKIDFQNNEISNSNMGSVQGKPDSIIKILSSSDNHLSAQLSLDIGVSSKYYNRWSIKKYGVQVANTNFYRAALAALGQSSSALSEHLIGNSISLMKDQPTTDGPYATLSAAIIRKFAVEYFTGTGQTLKNGMGKDLKDNAHILIVNGYPISMRQIITKIQMQNTAEDMLKLANIVPLNKSLNKWVGSVPSWNNAKTRSKNILDKLHSLQMAIKFHPEQFIQELL